MILVRALAITVLFIFALPMSSLANDNTLWCDPAEETITTSGTTSASGKIIEGSVNYLVQFNSAGIVTSIEAASNSSELFVLAGQKYIEANLSMPAGGPCRQQVKIIWRGGRE